MLATPVTKSRAMSFVALTKPRIIELLLIATIPTMFVAHGGLPSIPLMLFTFIGGALAAGGANAFNMYIDRDIDVKMNRTKGRPLVTGAVSPAEALVFALVIEILAFVWLWYFTNLLAAVLALSACLFYVFIYTMWLKRTSSQNIVIGGAAGAVPVLVGWAAVVNELSLAPWLLFAIIFFWTPPHFWALAIKYQEDYASVNVPMMPVVASFRTTAIQMTGYAAITWGLSLGFGLVAQMGYLYLASSMVLGFLFTYKAWKLTVCEDASQRVSNSIKYFQFSITYLSLLFGVMAVDQLVGWGP